MVGRSGTCSSHSSSADVARNGNRHSAEFECLSDAWLANAMCVFLPRHRQGLRCNAVPKGALAHNMDSVLTFAWQQAAQYGLDAASEAACGAVRATAGGAGIPGGYCTRRLAEGLQAAATTSPRHIDCSMLDDCKASPECCMHGGGALQLHLQHGAQLLVGLRLVHVGARQRRGRTQRHQQPYRPPPPLMPGAMPHRIGPKAAGAAGRVGTRQHSRSSGPQRCGASAGLLPPAAPHAGSRRRCRHLALRDLGPPFLFG